MDCLGFVSFLQMIIQKEVGYGMIHDDSTVFQQLDHLQYPMYPSKAQYPEH